MTKIAALALAFAAASALPAHAGARRPPFRLAQGEKVRILAVRARSEPTASVIELVGDRPLSFTSLKLPSPPRVVLDFADATFEGVPRELTVGDGTVRRVGAAPAGSRTARLVIELASDAEFDVRAQGNSLNVRVPRQTPLLAKASPPPAARAAPPAAEKPEPKPAEPAEDEPGEDKPGEDKPDDPSAAVVEATPAAPSDSDPAAAMAAAHAEAPKAEPAPQPAEEPAAPPPAAPVEAKREEPAAKPSPAIVKAAEPVKKPAPLVAKAEPEKKPAPPVVKAEPARKPAPAIASKPVEPVRKPAPIAAKPAEPPRPAPPAPDPRKKLPTVSLVGPARTPARATPPARPAPPPRAAPPPRPIAKAAPPRAVLKPPPAPPKQARTRKVAALRVHRSAIHGIGFRPDQGGVVIVRSDKPVAYTVADAGRELVLRMPGASIPLPNNRRPIETAVFGGAVERVLPHVLPDGVELRLQLRGNAAYHVEQSGGVLTVTFAPAG